MVSISMDFRSEPIRKPSAGPNRSFRDRKSAFVWSCFMPESIMPFSMPILASILAD